MKKKEIEKIPYLKLDKPSRKKEVLYIGVTAIKEIGQEKHLFLEIYRNKKDCKDVPVMRTVLTKKDFGTYWPETGEWDRKKLGAYAATPRWYTAEEGRMYRYTKVGENDILKCEDDRKRIEEFCKTKRIIQEGWWWGPIHHCQDGISYEERRKAERSRREKRDAALQDRISRTDPLPEERIMDWSNEHIFGNLHRLYYKKHGSLADIACSSCGNVTHGRWKYGDSYEEQFREHIEEPREGECGLCPACGTIGLYKCQGKVKKNYSIIRHVFLGQKYKETGMVARYVEVEKEWTLEIDDDKMTGAGESIRIAEVARGYFEEGKKLQIDYHKCGWPNGDYWDDCNLYGNANIIIGEAMIMPETYGAMQGTMFEYSALREYARGQDINLIEYFKYYQKTPQIEMLTKMRLFGVVKKLLRCEYGIVANWDANRLDEFLGIRKERIRQLITHEGDPELLLVMQAEKRWGKEWTAEQVEHLAEIGLGTLRIENALRYMSIQKLLNRIETYAGCQYGTGCSNAIHRLRQTATTYTDYLNMREERGYDLNNTVYQKPRNLQVAHDQMAAEINQEKVNNRLREVEEKYQNIAYNYRKLRKKYFYEDDKYIIRPARSAKEIVMEGRTLHHCVGGNNYLSKHDTGESYILLLRFKDTPEVPYITVEIDSKNYRILQWYGERDTKPDKENIQKWLNGYLKKLKTGTLTEMIQIAAIA